MTESSKKRKNTEKSLSAFRGSAALMTMFTKYNDATPVELKIIDSYSLYACATAAILLVYVCLVGTFPFNSFLGGFISCVASVVAAVSLRSQVNPNNIHKFPEIGHEKAFAEFCFFHVILHLAVIHFIG